MVGEINGQSDQTPVYDLNVWDQRPLVYCFKMIMHTDSWYWHFDSQAPVDYLNGCNQSPLAF